jgi:hypothetical protein
VESSIEWSGSLYYSVVGEPGDDNFEMTAEYLFLQDIGTHGFTSYEYGESWMKFMMENPTAMKLKLGHIHSHHNMGKLFV